MGGKTISHFEIVEKIGAGGMGEVYLARDLRLDRTVALKLLPAEFARDENRRKRLEREARAASALKHPNITHITTSARRTAPTSSRWSM
ncbi:MAG: protein kinase [Acidobacteriota bacterium]